MNQGDFREYANGFEEGVNKTRYKTFEETIDAEVNQPDVDYTSYKSIGNADGYNYGILLARSGRSMAMQSLEPEIDKCFTHAIQKHNEAVRLQK